MHYTTAVAFLFVSLVASESHDCPHGAISGSGSSDKDVEDNSYCCIGGQVSVSNCPGWPICTGPTSFDAATRTLTCATTIPVTASNYDALVSSANSKYLDEDGNIKATATGDDDATSSATGDTTLSDTSTSAVTTSAEDTIAHTTATADVTSDQSTGGAAAAMVTLLAPICGGAMAYMALP